MRDTRHDSTVDDVLSGDWAQTADAPAADAGRMPWRKLTLDSSPLARKIIAFNLVGLLILVGGVFYLNPFRDSLALQRVSGLQSEAALIANVFELQLATDGPTGLSNRSAAEVNSILDMLTLSPGVEVFIIGSNARIAASRTGPAPRSPGSDGSTIVTDFLNAAWIGTFNLLSRQDQSDNGTDTATLTRTVMADALTGSTPTKIGQDADGNTLLSVAAPIRQGSDVVGIVAMSSAAGEIDLLVRDEREQVLQMFVIAILVSIGLSLALASTIANPLADLATAAEVGRDRNNRKVRPGRVRIPDLTGRLDEIGRLSGALRGMVTALYDRIDANEQFAADVAHEIKNPLASLRSAVGTMRVARRDDQREKLLEVIDHDVRRLDRLVSDISNASRLDSELVKEDEECFDLVQTMTNLTEHFGREASVGGIDFVADLPDDRFDIVGLEARLAQVFVNLITNALSFCDAGDAVRVWVRKRKDRILVVVEDTGPGIPEQALSKIFSRFYSERPPGQFGDHSGLGLAISKQIVEAHGGVIWAENVRPTADDVTSEPLGARFVVGLTL